ncbi:uncharacterized protein S100757_00415 [Bacillus subtilis subsp. subtilis]|uniref:hypothetical protein n=1 Tax=Bacillus subtilis TaxID=1423 RepID=UPI000B3E5F14|nr:hypothetical protein [Bacillus subtilis]ARV97298.1 uncharacterized protein S101444_00415 [Bacillus subtilis subsp. subtilis]ARW01381.1 uncharacterized protein S100757_00415 [Bacillus subtilis subsp. subtilis]
MKILGVTGVILICLLAISVLMDMLQGFSLTKAVYNNMSSFKISTFAEWVVILFFVLVLVREIYVIYKSKKRTPRGGAFFRQSYCRLLYHCCVC